MSIYKNIARKSVLGLAGLVLGISGISGCSPLIQDEVNSIVYYEKKLRKSLNCGPGENYQIFGLKQKGKPIIIRVYGKDKTRVITYSDENHDGIYDKKETIRISGELKILPFPNSPDKKNYFKSPKNNKVQL